MFVYMSVVVFRSYVYLLAFGASFIMGWFHRLFSYPPPPSPLPFSPSLPLPSPSSLSPSPLHPPFSLSPSLLPYLSPSPLPSLSLHNRHLIQSGIWNTRTLAIDPTNTQNVNRIPDMTIQLAIKRWYENRNSTFEFRDVCVGPYCNNQCPEIFTLGELTSDNWPIWGKILIISVVVAIVVCMLFMKTLFVIWLYCVERKQNAYLDKLQNNIESSQSSLNLEVGSSVCLSVQNFIAC